ncbi:MAG: hypothetical protein WCF90_06035 [Methanomicrobiales archaeon]
MLSAKLTDISLKVDSGYLSEHKVITADIVIMNYDDNGWQEHPATFIQSTGNTF